MSSQHSNLFQQLEPLLATPEPPSLGPGPRADCTPTKLLESSLEAILSRAPSPPLPGDRSRLRRAALPASTREKIQSLLLLWHDHLDESHTISQSIHDPDGSFLHAIMHRREPDYGNSKYWWRHTGTHPAFARIAEGAVNLGTAETDSRMVEKLTANGRWDPFAFVDACESASSLAENHSRVQLLRKIQEVESRVLLEHLCNHAS